jgi:hypothetical protein
LAAVIDAEDSNDRRIVKVEEDPPLADAQAILTCPTLQVLDVTQSCRGLALQRVEDPALHIPAQSPEVPPPVGK